MAGRFVSFYLTKVQSLRGFTEAQICFFDRNARIVANSRKPMRSEAVINSTPVTLLVLLPSDSVTATSACSGNGYSLEVNGFVHPPRKRGGVTASITSSVWSGTFVGSPKMSGQPKISCTR